VRRIEAHEARDALRTVRGDPGGAKVQCASATAPAVGDSWSDPSMFGLSSFVG
jgi:hypothetical protein